MMLSAIQRGGKVIDDTWWQFGSRSLLRFANNLIESHLINHKYVNKTLTFFFLIIKHNDEYYSNLNIGKSSSKYKQK